MGSGQVTRRAWKVRVTATATAEAGTEVAAEDCGTRGCCFCGIRQNGKNNNNKKKKKTHSIALPSFLWLSFCGF